MRAALTQWRDGCLLEAFMIDDCKVTKNIDGSEVCRIMFPKTITVESGDKVNVTYYREKS